MKREQRTGGPRLGASVHQRLRQPLQRFGLDRHLVEPQDDGADSKLTEPRLSDVRYR